MTNFLVEKGLDFQSVSGKAAAVVEEITDPLSA